MLNFIFCQDFIFKRRLFEVRLKIAVFLTQLPAFKILK